MAPSSKRKNQFKSDQLGAGASDQEGADRPAKKGKSNAAGASPSEFKPSLVAQTDSHGDKYFELSRARRVTINEFRGKSLVNIREYYEKDGEMLPGKKGISLSVEQYAALIAILPQIEKLLSTKGERVPRPNYDGNTGQGQAEQEGDDGIREDEGDDQVDTKKANIEATSDEEE
ncbi:hypothetical protein DV735_g3077, partial [Chaetothyriales sp. CBS 134920]